ncbi:hypothetical protein ACWEQ4_01135 [Rhodococcus sp. NPDC003994]
MTTPVHDLVATSEKVSTLKFYKDNPRKGDVAVIAESLASIGQYRPIVVNIGTHTGRKNEVLAGNHTLKAAKKLGWEHIQVVHVDVDEEGATRIVLADNKTADLGGYDDAILTNLLVDLPDLAGTGYTVDDLDDLLADARDAAEAAAKEAAAAAGGDEPVEKGKPEPKYDEDDSGMLNRKSLDEKLEGYAQSDSRSVILSYVGDQYVWVVEKLTEIGDALDTDSNAGTVLALIAAHTGEQPPAPTAAPADDDAPADAE